MTAIIIFIVIIALLFVFRKKTFVKDNGPILYFVLTTVATLIGVVLAVNLSEKQALVKEKEDLVKVINSGISVSKLYKNISGALINANNSSELKALKLKEKEADSLIIDEINLPKLDFLDNLLSDNSLSKLLSQETLSTLHEFNLNMEVTRNSQIAIYMIYIDMVIKTLGFERDFQLNKITLTELKSKHEETKDSLLIEIMKLENVEMNDLNQ